MSFFDFLSHPNQTITGSVAAASPADPVDFEEMAAEQNRCPETQHLLGGTSLKLAFRQTGAQRLAGDVSTDNFRPNVPLKFRKNLFHHFHNVAHPGRLTSCRIISSRFVWRGLSSDVTAWARGCLACQWGKIHRHTRLVPLPIRPSHLGPGGRPGSTPSAALRWPLRSPAPRSPLLHHQSGRGTR